MGLTEKLKQFVAALSRPGSFARSTAILAGGAATGQLVALLASPIVTRLYPPAQVGTLGLFANVLSFIAPVACLRYEASLSIPKDDQKATRLLVASLLSSVLVAVVVLVLVTLFGRTFSIFCNDPGLSPFLWLVPLSVLGVGVYQSFSFWAIRHREFGLAAKTRVVQGVAQVACHIGFGVLKAGPVGLILGDVLGRIGGAGTIASMAWKRHKASLRELKVADVTAAAKEYWAFPLLSGPAALLHTATTNFTLILAPMYGRDIYGLYFFGIRFLWGPVSLVGQAMAQVYLGEASRWAREDPDRMLRSFDTIVKRLAKIGVLPFGILAAIGGPFSAFVFGKAYFEAGVLVQIQAVSWWAMFVVGPVIATLNILGKQRWQLWADAAGVVLMSAGFYASWQFHWSPRIAVALYAGAIVFMYAWLYLACRKAIVHCVREGVSETVQDVVIEP